MIRESSTTSKTLFIEYESSDRRMTSLQEEFNDQAERNRHTDGVIMLSYPGEIRKLRHNNFEFNVYLSSNCKTVSIIMDQPNTPFELPKFATSMQVVTSKSPDDNFELEYHMKVQRSSQTEDELHFIKRYYANLKQSFVVIYKDETYDYETQYTGSYYVPVMANISKRPGEPELIRLDAVPVQIFFCITPERFIEEWNKVVITNDVKHDSNYNELRFPYKFRYFQYFRFHIELNTISTPPMVRPTALVEEVPQLGNGGVDSSEAREEARQSQLTPALEPKALTIVKKRKEKPKNKTIKPPFPQYTTHDTTQELINEFLHYCRQQQRDAPTEQEPSNEGDQSQRDLMPAEPAEQDAVDNDAVVLANRLRKK